MEEAVGKLGVVLKQGVLPGGAVALAVLAIGQDGRAAADGRGAARGVAYIHVVAEQLAQKLDICRLRAAGAGGGELEVRLGELHVLDGLAVDHILLQVLVVHGDLVEVRLFGLHLLEGGHDQGGVALDPTTGAVRGLVGRVGGTSDTTFRNFNYATQGKRSPGSTIKPLVVYAPALASGWSINKDLPNKPIDYNGYTPTNYGGVETEDVPMYQALANSYNVPAVYLFNQIGIQKGISYGQKFGLNFDNVPEELGISLGGGVTASPLQMAQAYATFANGGEMNTAYFITKIENASGDIIATHSKKSKRVISQSVANQMTSMMLGTFSNGSAVNANYTGYTMAGKTGTVQAEFNKDLTSDQWVIGYTPDVVMTTWIGFDKTDESHYLTGASSGTASTIFSYIAADVLPNTPGTEFTVENAYAADGQTLDYTADPNDSRNSSNKSWTDKASDVVNDVKDQASSLWDKITDSFSGLFR